MIDAVPEGWQIGRISESADNVTEKYQKRIGYNPRYVGLEHIPSNTKRLEEWGYADQITSSKTNFRKGDTLFGKLRPYLEKVVFAEFDGICSTDILAIRPKKDVEPEFLYRTLSKKETIAKATESSVGNVMPRTSWAALREVNFLKPPYPEQQKIATILSSVDDVIEKTRAQIDKLKDLKTGMMQELLTQGIGHTEFKDSPVGRIPASWRTVALGDTGDWKGGGTPSKSNKSYWQGAIPWVSPKDMGAERIIRTENQITELAVSESSTNVVQAGAILMVVRSGILRHTLPVAIAGPKVAINQDMKALVVNEGFSEEYVFQYLLAKNQHVLQATLKVGNTVESIDFNELNKLVIPCPPREEQEAIAKAVESVAQRIRVKTSQLASYTKLKNSLMQDLLTGNVRVNVDQKESEVA